MLHFPTAMTKNAFPICSVFVMLIYYGAVLDGNFCAFYFLCFCPATEALLGVKVFLSVYISELFMLFLALYI